MCGPVVDAAALRIALTVVVPAGLGGSWRCTSTGKLRAYARSFHARTIIAAVGLASVELEIPVPMSSSTWLV